MLNCGQEILTVVRHSDDQLPELVTNNHKIHAYSLEQLLYNYIYFDHVI